MRSGVTDACFLIVAASPDIAAKRGARGLDEEWALMRSRSLGCVRWSHSFGDDASHLGGRGPGLDLVEDEGREVLRRPVLRFEIAGFHGCLHGGRWSAGIALGVEPAGDIGPGFSRAR